MVGYWKFDEGSGSTADDSSGNGNTGTLTNGPTWTSGKVSGALSFDGNNDYVNAGNAASLQLGTGDFSVGLWFKSSDISDYQNIMVQKATWLSGSQQGWGIFISDIGKVALRTTNTVASTLNIYNDNIWHHFYAIRTGSTARFYMDGNLENTGTAVTETVSSAQPLVMGYRSDSPSWYFNGLIDDVRIYNRALSAAEIMAIYNATK